MPFTCFRSTLFSLAFAATALAHADMCAQPPPALRALSCSSNQHGAYFAIDAARAALYAEAAGTAAERFQRYFGRAASSGAIVEIAALDAATRAELARQGAKWVLNDAPAPSMAGSIRSQLSAQLADQPQAEIDRQVEAVLAQLGGAQLRSANSSTDALQRQIGDALLRLAFWPKAAQDAASYGSPAPDWFDELAAVLMETEQTSMMRRQHLRAALSDPTHARSTIAQCLARQHPASPMLGAEGAAASASISVQRVSVADAATAAAIVQQRQAADLPYAYSRALADFLLKPSQDLLVYSSLAQALAQGGSLADWLRTDGARFGLPENLNALQSAWSAWLDQQAKSARGTP